MSHRRPGIWAGALLALAAVTAGVAAEETVATAVYAKIGHGYKREKAKDGTYTPEYYALSNGGRIFGTTSDLTVDRVTYPEVAQIAMQMLARQNYRYAQAKEQAKLLLVLQWGSTLAPDDTHKQMNVASAQAALDELKAEQRNLSEKLVSGGASGANAGGETRATLEGFGPSITSHRYTNQHAVLAAAASTFESQMLRTMLDNRVRDELNQRNARVLGYVDDLADSGGIRRWAGGGDLYQDLITDVEESRYYIVVSAYDFPELLKTNKQKLLWQVRVSVRSPGNAFNDSLIAMMKSASRYFGQDSGKLVRGEEIKGSVELGDLKFLGEAKAPEKPATKEKK